MQSLHKRILTVAIAASFGRVVNDQPATKRILGQALKDAVWASVQSAIRGQGQKFSSEDSKARRAIDRLMLFYVAIADYETGFQLVKEDMPARLVRTSVQINAT
jgi:hypothetical protein